MSVLSYIIYLVSLLMIGYTLMWITDIILTPVLYNLNINGKDSESIKFIIFICIVFVLHFIIF